MINSVLVLGGGSAGFLAAATLKHRLPDLQVTVLRSPDIGIIGVGEATTLAVPRHLHNYLNIDHAEFHRLAEPTWKVGIRFLWGPRPFFDYGFGLQMDTRYAPLPKATGYYCEDIPFDNIGFPSALMSQNKVFLRQQSGLPLMNGDVAYHIENEKFVGFLETFSHRLGVQVQEDTMLEVIQDESGVRELKLKSGQTATADLFIDCSGFASVLLGRTLGEGFVSFTSSLYCDRAVIGGWDRAEEPIKPYTTAETMNAGWCW
jgi:tryptophan 7-halogenase